MKKIKENLFIIILLLLLFIIGVSIVLYISSKKDKISLNLSENQWIDNNKHEVIDIALINNIPIISYDGEGIIYDYLDYVKKNTSLEFNIIPYKYGDNVDYKYKLDIVKEIKTNDVVLYQDNLIYISADNKEYDDLDEITNLKIGILESDKDFFTKYFEGKNIELVVYDNNDKLKSAISEAKANISAGTASNINGIIISKTLYTKEIIEQDCKIAYEFNDLPRYFILNIQDSHEFNSIMKKEYDLWKEQKYKESYNTNLLYNYYNFKKLSDVDQKKLKSKSYTFGFIDNGIMSYIKSKKLSGFTGILLKEFNDFSGITIAYTRYNSVNKLIEDFNKKKVDFILNNVDKEKISLETQETSNVFEKKYVVVSGINNMQPIYNVTSLNNKEVLVIKDTDLEAYLKKQNAKVKSYNDLTSLVKDFKANDIVVLDLENYNYYKSSKFKDARISYIFNNNANYNFLVSKDDSNKEFLTLYNFYLTYTPINDIISKNYKDVAYENKNITYVLVFIIIALLFYVVIDFISHVKKVFKALKVRKKTKMTKEDKMKYIDQLTSLKNRNYLNSKIEEWDDSEVYPQSVIVIDLNNVSYINDNYGREEGDKVIKEAANILIQYQLENSEIIRTDGNEFLIFLVGYTEKQVIAYLRRLAKEFKNLSHGFGAASGYSIITDAIKTFDDAVNEAVLDMKNNKEDIEY